MSVARKIIKNALISAFLLLLFISSAYADSTEKEIDQRFEGKTWAKAVSDFVHDYNRDARLKNICIGYYNTVTGEEHYLNPDNLTFMCSMYKVPLNMLAMDRIAEGEMSMDTQIRKIPYSEHLDKIILASDNDSADMVINYLYPEKGYSSFKTAICEYFDADPEELPEDYYNSNKSTARFMISCLKKLYDGKDDRYSELVARMLKAEQHNYFLLHKQKYDVAHKYGQYHSDTLYTNDCAIIYTPQPILLVVFSRRIQDPAVFLTELCSFMIDYTLYNS